MNDKSVGASYSKPAYKQMKLKTKCLDKTNSHFEKYDKIVHVNSSWYFSLCLCKHIFNINYGWKYIYFFCQNKMFCLSEKIYLLCTYAPIFENLLNQ